MKSIRNTLLSVVPVLALTVNLLPAQAGVLAPGSAYNGKTLGEWSAEWNKYVYSIPEFTGPLWDTTGEKANINQSGDVFFLVGTFTGEPVTRKITVNENQLLFLPLVNVWNNNFGLPPNTPPQTGEELANFNKQVIDGTTSLFFNLDGVALSMDQLFQHRETPPPFNVTLPENNFYGAPAGSSSLVASDGYWLMVDPLSVGKHTISFGGSLTFFGQSFPQNNTYEISVVSVPEPTVIVGLLGLGVCMGISRRKQSL
ncbi:MAG TPA: hypothetical protein DDW76_18995 [Cyanobacteria bacterium UBA11369]|nr:hypothetical protein [Cyanobacteria bacterium UBA11371]HBE32695.1 hypothetical protein [Cyanobacteria bacterium UBA11368]HBE50800.1 hypothetical protein [Cyanobacteria bacterium UBA11369]